MATVLPGSPPAFDKGNETGTVRAICNYLRQTHDNVDFQLGQVRKTLETQQKMITALTEKNAALRENYEALAARVAALEQKS